MLAEPGERLARDERFAGDVGGGGGEAGHQGLRRVLADVALVAAVAGDGERARAERLGFRDVDERVEVEEVRGRAVALIAREPDVSMAPVDPCADVFEMKFVER